MAFGERSFFVNLLMPHAKAITRSGTKYSSTVAMVSTIRASQDSHGTFQVRALQRINSVQTKRALNSPLGLYHITQPINRRQTSTDASFAQLRINRPPMPAVPRILGGGDVNKFQDVGALVGDAKLRGKEMRVEKDKFQRFVHTKC